MGYATTQVEAEAEGTASAIAYLTVALAVEAKVGGTKESHLLMAPLTLAVVAVVG
jgi:hypothetical protein